VSLRSFFADRRLRGRMLALALGIGLGGIVLFAVRPWRGGSKALSFKRTTTDATSLMEARARERAGDDGHPVVLPGAHLPRFPIGYETAKVLFPIDQEVQEFDPQVYFRRPAFQSYEIEWPEHPEGRWTVATNSLGLREDGEPMLRKPHLRILVAGDSHAEGVCNNPESLAHVLGRALSERHPGKYIESINAAKGGYTFYNYLGTLQKFLYLEPDVFVVAVYGPNDFEEVLTPYHYFSGTTRAPGSALYWPQVENALAICAPWLAQDGNSLKYFQEQPSEIKEALHAAEEATLDIQDICKASKIALIYVYIPGRFDAEDPACLASAENPELAQQLYAALEVRPESTKVHDNMANVLLSFLAEQQIPALDLRAVFRQNKGPFYWALDHHINLNAHRIIGESLVPLIEGAGLPGLR
jgi:hypothetical protein